MPRSAPAHQKKGQSHDREPKNLPDVARGCGAVRGHPDLRSMGRTWHLRVPNVEIRIAPGQQANKIQNPSPPPDYRSPALLLPRSPPPPQPPTMAMAASKMAKSIRVGPSIAQRSTCPPPALLLPEGLPHQ